MFVCLFPFQNLNERYTGLLFVSLKYVCTEKDPASLPVTGRHVLSLHLICRFEPRWKLPSFRSARVATTFLVTAASMKTFISSRVLKVKILWTVPLAPDNWGSGICLWERHGVFPNTAFLTSSENECCEWQAPLEYWQAVIPCRNHSYSEEIPNLTVRTVFLHCFFLVFFS